MTSGRLAVVDQDQVLVALPDRAIDAGHGSFDNDLATMSDALVNIIGGPLEHPIDDLRGF